MPPDAGAGTILSVFGIAFGVVGIVVVVLGFMGIASYFSEGATTLRAMRAAPQVRIAGAKDGAKVRLVGRVASHGEERLAAPLSGRACVAFRVHVEERVRGRKSSHWRTMLDEREAVDFVLEDKSGRAIVCARGGKLLIDLDHRQGSGTFHDATPALESYLAQHGQQSTGMLGFNKQLRYREGALEIGETVAVVGVARWEDDPGAASEPVGFRDASRKKRLVIEPGPDGALYASDTLAATG